MTKFYVRLGGGGGGDVTSSTSSTSSDDLERFLQTFSRGVRLIGPDTFECTSDLGVPAFRRRVTTTIAGAIVSTSAPSVNKWAGSLVPFKPYVVTDVDTLTEADRQTFAERTRAVYREMDKPFPYPGSSSRQVKETRLVQVYLDPFGCSHAPRSLADRRRLCLLLRPDIFDESDPLLDQLTCIELLKKLLNNSGSTCVPSRSFYELEDFCSAIFGGSSRARAVLSMAMETGAIQASESRATYLVTDYRRESLIVRCLRTLIRSSSCEAFEIPSTTTWGVVTPNDAQCLAIRMALTMPCSIITGFAGTGKTFVVSQIVNAILRGRPPPQIALCAPTGAAAKRMRESLRTSGVDVDRVQIGTIHSSILYEKPNMVPLGFAPSVDFVIVDEMSMVDLKTMSYLFLGDNNPRRRFVFVGDPGQLPSVSRGKIFSDLINSERIPISELTEIVRQSGGSEIAELAAQIRTGSSMTVLVLRNNPCPQIIPFDPSVQVFFETGFATVRELLNRSIDVFNKEVATSGGDPFNVQVLCPRVAHKGDEGTFQVCCEDFNPEFSSANTVEVPYQYPPVDDWFAEGRYSPEEIVSFKRLVDEFNEVHDTRFVTSKFCRGERVVCRKNNADGDKVLVNGDMGTVESARYEVQERVWKYTVLFRDVDSGPIEMTDEHLEMAYVTSVHKAQGNEYDSVVLLFGRNDNWVWRELLYTAVTRAKKRLTILAMDEGVVRGCIRNVAAEKRTSELCELLM